MFYSSDSFYNKNKSLFDRKSINVFIANRVSTDVYISSNFPSENGELNGFNQMNKFHIPGYWPLDTESLKPIPSNSNYNLSRGNALSHEIGHNFNLYHPFQSPSNRIIDLPQGIRLNSTYSEPILTNDNKGYQHVNNIMGVSWSTTDPKTNMWEGFTHYQMIK